MNTFLKYYSMAELHNNKKTKAKLKKCQTKGLARTESDWTFKLGLTF